MIRLITIMLCLFVSICVPAAGDYTATLSPDDPLPQISENPKPKTTNEKQDGAHAAPNNSSQDIAPLVQQLSAIADQATVDQEDQYNQAMRENRANDIAVRDLEAQRTMADFARYLFVVTTLGTVVGAIGLFMLYRTLHHTRRTADAAITQAQHARAWIIISHASVVLASSDFDNAFSVRVMSRVAGYTPAREIMWELGWVIVDANIASSELPEIALTERGSFGVAPPDKNPTLKHRLSLNEACQICESHALYSRARFTYKTLFDDDIRVSESVIRTQTKLTPVEIVEFQKNRKKWDEIKVRSNAIGPKTTLT